KAEMPLERLAQSVRDQGVAGIACIYRIVMVHPQNHDVLLGTASAPPLGGPSSNQFVTKMGEQKRTSAATCRVFCSFSANPQVRQFGKRTASSAMVGDADKSTVSSCTLPEKR